MRRPVDTRLSGRQDEERRVLRRYKGTSETDTKVKSQDRIREQRQTQERFE